MKDNKITKKELWLSLPIGALAGFVNGFLGTGGGIILLMSSSLIARSENPKNRFAETLAVTMVFSAVSAVIYFLGNAELIWESAAFYASPALFGGAVGAILLGIIPSKATKKIFAGLVALAGILMVFR